MSTIDEGYIKFDMAWKRQSIQLPERWKELSLFRTKLFDRQLIGMYENGIGFGNVSCRLEEEGQFLISGTQTGHKRILDEEDYAVITEFNIDENKVWCKGPIKASSESMTHAAIYRSLLQVNFIFHIHSAAYWEKWKHVLPTTASDIPYGTPQMAKAISQTVQEGNGQPVIMAGHEEGIVLYGITASQTFAQLEQLR